MPDTRGGHSNLLPVNYIPRQGFAFRTMLPADILRFWSPFNEIDINLGAYKMNILILICEVQRFPFCCPTEFDLSPGGEYSEDRTGDWGSRLELGESKIINQ